MDNIIIRTETEKDHRAVEELTREAFWNVYKPGADEHYFVHQMRNHPDFIPELALVAETEGRIIGNIMYTKAWLDDENGVRKEILSFGPLCVSPGYQRHKVGKRLISHSFDIARSMGYDVNINFGNPGNYVSSGFVSCKKKNVSFVVEGNNVRVINSAVYAMQILQAQMAGEAERAGLSSEEDVVKLVKDVRAE